MAGVLKIKEKINNLVSNFCWEIGVDLGSSNTLIFLKDRGVVIDEPTMLARPKKRFNRLSPVAFGLRAKEMLNREPRQLEVISPIKNGMIFDLEAAESLISYYLKLVYEVPSKYPKFFKPRVIVGVPSFLNYVQKRAIKSIFMAAGARDVVLVEAVILAALGMGFSIDSSGLVIVDIGGGKVEINVISMGGVVVGKGINIAGDDFDLSIVNYVKMKYGLLIGRKSAERIKVELGRLDNEKENKVSVIRGRDMETGLPKSVKLCDEEVREAISLDVSKIVKLISCVLDETPPELMGDILKRGIILIGNGAKIRGISKLIEAETKINTTLMDDSGMCVIKGCGELVQNRELLKQVKLVSRF